MGKHSREFKLEAIRMMREGERPVAEIARELGLKRELLYRWRDEYDKKPDQAFRGSGRPKSDEGNELTRLRRENAELKEERDILKKAAAYFAKGLK
jgi:transposase